MKRWNVDRLCGASRNGAGRAADVLTMTGALYLNIGELNGLNVELVFWSGKDSVVGIGG